MKVAFLIGSGVSSAPGAGLPSTSELTDRILAAKRVTYHTSHTFYVREEENAPLFGDHYVASIRDLLGAVMDEIEPYLEQRGGEANYEDIYFVIDQLVASKSGELDNPFVEPLLANATSSLGPGFYTNPGVPEEEPLLRVAEHSLGYIRDMVSASLSSPQRAGSHLRVLREAIAFLGPESVDLVTTNHDTLLEDALAAWGVGSASGFGPLDGDFCPWQPSSLAVKAETIRLFKIHGSVDWFRLRRAGGSWEEETIGSYRGFPGLGLRNGHGEAYEALDNGRPSILIGTLNKVLEYSRGLFHQLHCLMATALEEARVLVVSGYGFGDKAVNMRIAEWYRSQRDRVLVLITPSPRKLRHLPASIWAERDNLASAGRLIEFPCGFQEVTWTELQRELAVSAAQDSPH